MLAALLALQALVAPPNGEAAASPNGDPFAFLRPSVTVSADDRRHLDAGEPAAHTVDGQGLELAVFAVVPVNVDGDRLVTWVRRIEELKKSPYVLAIGRFSSPPRIEDLAGLSLDDNELSAVRRCHPGSCALKLSAGEMTDLQNAAAAAPDDWKAAVQQAFRRAVLQRVQKYLADGQVPPYEDQTPVVEPAMRFRAVLDHALFLGEHLPRVAEHLRRYPPTTAADIESFLYWSKERLGNKATISVTHVNIVRSHDPGLPDAFVAGKEIYCTHYVNASLGLTALVRGAPGGPNYLVYVNRTEVDVLGGTFSGLIRWFLQRRLKAEAGGVLGGLRKRLESGDPPAAHLTGSN